MMDAKLSARPRFMDSRRAVERSVFGDVALIHVQVAAHGCIFG